MGPGTFLLFSLSRFDARSLRTRFQLTFHLGGRSERIHTDRAAVVRPPDVGHLPCSRRPKLDRLCLKGIHQIWYHRRVPPRQARRARLRLSQGDQEGYEVEQRVAEDGRRPGELRGTRGRVAGGY